MNAGLASGTPHPTSAQGMCTSQKVRTMIRRTGRCCLQGLPAKGLLPPSSSRSRSQLNMDAEQTRSPSWQEEGPGDQAGAEVPKLERDAQVGRGIDTGATTLGTSPVPPGFQRMATLTAGASGFSGLHKIRRTIHRSNK